MRMIVVVESLDVLLSQSAIVVDARVLWTLMTLLSDN